MNFAGSGLPGLLKPNYAPSGYVSVQLSNRRRVTIHRLVMATFVGPARGREVNHINGIKDDNRLENLEYCTRSENMKHAFASGLQSNKGERHSQSLLTEGDVRKIYALAMSGIPQPEIAKSFGIYQSVVSRIKSRKAWAHVEMAVQS